MTFRQAFEGALLEILRTRDLLAVAVLSVLFYAFYYPAPYAHQVAQDLPIVVVDADYSMLSRTIIRNLGAAHEVSIVAQVPDMATAQARIRQRSAEGILYLPPGLASSLLSARGSSGVAVWLNGAYLLRVEAVGTSIAGSIAAVAGRQLAGVSPGQDTIPVAIETQPLFNTTAGYRDYVFPSVANIILQQTLLFSAARLCAERRRRGTWPSGRRAFAGIWAACTLIGAIAGFLYFGLVFWVQDIPRGGNIPALLPLVPLYAATVAALGLAVGSFMRDGDDALKLLIPTSIPFVFLSGFAWPLFAMPLWVRAIAWSIPVTSAAHLFIPLNQMAASWADVIWPVTVMAMEVVLFTLIAAFRLNRK